jgi:hypothetical protein
MPMPTGIRLKSADAEVHERFNYTGMHRYLLTLPAHGATFTVRERVTLVLDALREASWRHHFDVYAYSFLPDRLLLIVRGKEETSHLKSFLRDFRMAADGALAPSLGHPLWRKKYLERVLRKTEVSSDIAHAIFATPVALGLARSPTEYLLQGSFVKDIRVLAGGGTPPSAPPGRPPGRKGGRGPSGRPTSAGDPQRKKQWKRPSGAPRRTGGAQQGGRRPEGKRRPPGA